MELTTKQLLFAHRIGATHFRSNVHTMLYRKINDHWHCSDIDYELWTKSLMPGGEINDHIHAINFTPLYDWMDHDGGECPVLPVDMVQFSGKAGRYLASTLDWGKIKRFRLEIPTTCTEDDEQRSEVIGQNGNDGEHYDIPPPEYDPRDVAFKSPAKSKYHREIAPGIWVDVYDVLKAWSVENPALQHLIKKSLQPGERGHKTLDQDMDDIIASAKRAKELI